MGEGAAPTAVGSTTHFMPSIEAEASWEALIAALDDLVLALERGTDSDVDAASAAFRQALRPSFQPFFSETWGPLAEFGMLDALTIELARNEAFPIEQADAVATVRGAVAVALVAAGPPY